MLFSSIGHIDLISMIKNTLLVVECEDQRIRSKVNFTIFLICSYFLFFEGQSSSSDTKTYVPKGIPLKFSKNGSRSSKNVDGKVQEWRDNILDGKFGVESNLHTFYQLSLLGPCPCFANVRGSKAVCTDCSHYIMNNRIAREMAERKKVSS